jgi:two-component system response regulator HydG
MDVARSGLCLASDAIDALMAYSWPGNVRELQNILERAVLLASAPEIRATDMRFEAAPMRIDTPTDAGIAGFPTLAQVEQAHIARAMRLAGGRVAEAARLLGMSRSTLYERLRALPSESRP